MLKLAASVANSINRCAAPTFLSQHTTHTHIHTNKQLSLPEPEWQARHGRLSLQLLSAGASGVYEGQMPLGLQAALSLGCVATVVPAARQRQLGDGFDLDELQVPDFSFVFVKFLCVRVIAAFAKVGAAVTYCQKYVCNKYTHITHITHTQHIHTPHTTVRRIVALQLP